MTPDVFQRLRQRLALAFEGELATLAPHDRREQRRRQVQLLHLPLSALMLAFALFEALRVAFMAAFELLPVPALNGQAVAVVALVALALRFRAVPSMRRRRLLGSVLFALLTIGTVVPALEWRGDTLLPFAGLLILPVASLPLMVNPRITYRWVALCLLAVATLLAVLEVGHGQRLLFGFYFLVSLGAGLLLRRARANLATRMDQQVASLWERAVSDPLTGLLNRYGWMSLAGTALSDALAAGRTPAVLFLDLDFFKRTNDRHGHLAGDELLRRLGRLVSTRVGHGELAARLGGEEIAVLLPHASPAQARRFAERLRDDYRALGADFDSTVSIGIAVHRVGDLLNDLLARADAALYAAKHGGRDRIVLADDAG